MVDELTDACLHLWGNMSVENRICDGEKGS